MLKYYLQHKVFLNTHKSTDSILFPSGDFSVSKGTLNLYYITTVWLSGCLSSHLSGARPVCFCVCEAIPFLMAFVFPTEIQAFRFPLGSPVLSIKMKDPSPFQGTISQSSFNPTPTIPTQTH